MFLCVGVVFQLLRGLHETDNLVHRKNEAERHADTCSNISSILLSTLHTPADPDEDVIDAEGIMKLCEDLGIEPADIVTVGAVSGALLQSTPSILTHTLKHAYTHAYTCAQKDNKHTHTRTHTVQLVIAFHMNAESMGEFSKSEFSEGMLKMGVDSLDKLKKKLPDLRAELLNPERFHDIYNYAYMFSREVSLA